MMFARRVKRMRRNVSCAAARGALVGESAIMSLDPETSPLLPDSLSCELIRYFKVIVSVCANL